MLAIIECPSYTKQRIFKDVFIPFWKSDVPLPEVRMKGPGNFCEIFHHQYLHKYFHSNSTPAQI